MSSRLVVAVLKSHPCPADGYDGLEQREASICEWQRIRLTDALQRLVDLDSAWDQPEEAARLQKKPRAIKADKARDAKEDG
jgi:hypothetical protein